MNIRTVTTKEHHITLTDDELGFLLRMLNYVTGLGDVIVIDDLNTLVDRLRNETLSNTEKKLEEVTRERDALLKCRRGEQNCHECPDTNCCDNTNKESKKDGQ